MSILDTLKGIAGNTPAGLITSAVSTVLDRILPEDPAAKQAAAIEIMKLQAEGTFDQKAALQLQTAQLDVDKAEAQSADRWRGGWRPFIGWTCGCALFSQYVLRPWVEFACVAFGHPLPKIPGIDDQLWQLMGVLLGMGTLRTAEKIKGAA